MKAMCAAALMLVSATGVSAKEIYSDFEEYALGPTSGSKIVSKKFNGSKSFLDDHLATVRRGDRDGPKPGNHLTGGYMTGSGRWVPPSYTTNPGAAASGRGPFLMPGASREWNEANPFLDGRGSRR